MVHAAVQLFGSQFAVFYGPNQRPGGVVSGGGHFQIGSGGGALYGIVGAAPVGDYDPVESPFAAQDILEKVAVFVGVNAVDLIVAAHDGMGAALFDCDFESG